MKKVVISGATSMLGLALIEECMRNSIEVIAIAHRGSKKLARIPKSDLVKVIELDLDEFGSFDPSPDRKKNDPIERSETIDPNPDRKIFEPSVDDPIRAEVFYHFAWSSTGRGADGSDLRLDAERQSLNIGWTLDAVRLAKRFGCRKFFFAGSQAEYGPNDRALNRETPIKPKMAYGVAKFAAGNLASILCQALGLEFVHARILSVYGVNDGEQTLISYLIRSYLDGKRPQLTAGEQLWDYLNADDAARCFRMLGESDASGVYCIGSGLARPLREYIEIIHRLTGSTVELIFGEKPYAPNQVMHLEADITDLRRDIGFEPTITFEEGIKRIVDARRSQKKSSSNSN